MPTLSLAHGLAFADLYHREGLQRIDAAFLSFLRDADAGLAEGLTAARLAPAALAKLDESTLIIAVGPHLDDFIGELFGISAEVAALSGRHHTLGPIYTVKRQLQGRCRRRL